MLYFSLQRILPFQRQSHDDEDEEDDEDDEDADEGVDRQLVRMGYRFLVRGCKGL